MLRNYVTTEEFYRFHAVEKLLPIPDLQKKLGSATVIVGNDLREGGNNLASFQIPVMMNTTEAYQKTTFTQNTIGTAVSAKNAMRLVVWSGTTPVGEVKVKLEGSYDESLWIPILDITDQLLEVYISSDSFYSGLFNTKYPYYRYEVITDESVDLAIFLLDTSVDELIRWKTLELGMLEIIEPDSRSGEIYNVASRSYVQKLTSLRADYVAMYEEPQTRNRKRMYR